LRLSLIRKICDENATSRTYENFKKEPFMSALSRIMKTGFFGLILTFAFAGFITCSKTPKATPPVAQIMAHPDTINGDVREDNYFWLRERGDSNVIAYLEAENAYIDTMMKHTEDDQEELFQELKGRIRETDEDVPAKKGNYFYYTRREEGKQYQIYCRKEGNLQAAEQIILDVNQLAEGHAYCNIGVYQVSPDHKMLAYSVDTTGAETYDLHFKNLETGEILADVIPGTSYSCEWANDNKTVFYTTMDETRRPDKVHRHTIGSDYAKDALVFHEPDQSFFTGVGKTRSDKYLLISVGSISTSEFRFLDAGTPTGKFTVVAPRQKDIEYYVDHHGDLFYISSNENAKNFKLLTAPVKTPARANWKEIIPHRDSVKIDGYELFRNHLVILERENGLNNIRVINLTTNDDFRVEFPEPVYDFQLSGNLEFDTDQLRFIYFSLVTPRSVFDYNLNSKERELKKEYEVKSYDRTLYESQRIFATAADGRKIPMSVVYKKPLKQDGNSPLYLYGYGAYGYSLDPYFSSNRISYLDRGFIYVIAHVRGGGEMGRYWYDEGKLMNKKNTFSDFIACAEHLVAEKYTSPEKMVCGGGSAGGLLIGAVVNMRPDLFKVAIADVPFVDVMNTMLDSTIPLTVTEYEEWGNPNDSAFYWYMKSYSPYDNVSPQKYPNMLVTAGLNDPRVQYWEPAKWCAKLRALKQGNELLLLKTNMGAGHGGASGRYDFLKEIAFEMAFVFDRLKIKV
jgi:oligopeptidase B